MTAVCSLGGTYLTICATLATLPAELSDHVTNAMNAFGKMPIATVPAPVIANANHIPGLRRTGSASAAWATNPRA